MRIFVKEIVQGLHNWPGAVKPVEFLSNEHAHDFYIYVACDVKHSDRELEFYMLRNFIRNILDTKFDKKGFMIDFKNSSCEIIALEIRNQLILKYGARNWLIKVSEEGLQGAIL